MKKLFLLPLFAIALAGCSSGSVGCTCSSSNAKLIESVNLSLDNFSKYIATNTIRTFVGNTDYSSYHTQFIGADDCRFINCTIEYSFVYMNNEPGGAGTGTVVPLTISGDGETKPFVVRVSQNTGYYSFALIAVTGTVEVYR